MPKLFKNLTKVGLLSLAIANFTVILPKPAASQLLPQVWGTVGTKDDDISYGAGVRLLNFGVEVGTGEEGATGGDILTFFPLPVVSPYVGLGIYSGDDTVAYSGGVHINPPGNFFFGGGYHSIRGINGKIGFKF
ncbi:hypothetical protein Sta7437_0375 [Stanieria cyanosphaera PCC 7437]|uniref:Uncharacterized protein n=1 Tax=Stanieria cyanosphaera (strain ATCC 29371 / PCC 7437) TaxID=111780 RepID=K9XPK5_STAC7|nr:hypothetical protein [Stanieria cyanosphaera]AFZ33986.1 hypothetical protein Sta7437_0375 [Stanieria cyanosphaera PCC 7437]